MKLESISILSGSHPSYSVGMVRVWGLDAIALARDLGCGVDVWPTRGRGGGTVVMSPRNAGYALELGRRVSLIVAASLDV